MSKLLLAIFLCFGFAIAIVHSLDYYITLEFKPESFENVSGLLNLVLKKGTKRITVLFLAAKPPGHNETKFEWYTDVDIKVEEVTGMYFQMNPNPDCVPLYLKYVNFIPSYKKKEERENATLIYCPEYPIANSKMIPMYKCSTQDGSE